MISVAALAVTLLALIGCAFLGGQLVPAKLARSERFVIAFGVGSALISLAFFALGVFHLFRPGILMGVAAMLTLAGCAFLALQFRGLRTPSLSLSGVVSLSPIVIIAFLTLLSACAQ